MDPTGYTTFLMTFIAITTVILVIACAGCLYFIVDLHRNLSTIVDLHRRVTVDAGLAISHPKRPFVQATGALKEEEPESSIRTDIDLAAAGSLQEHLAAIAEKYSLTSFTLATTDGLVIGSTRSDPQKEAAEWSYLYQQGERPENEDVRLIGVPHKGETVIGIARPVRKVSSDALPVLEQDVGEALRRWV